MKVYIIFLLFLCIFSNHVRSSESSSDDDSVLHDQIRSLENDDDVFIDDVLVGDSADDITPGSIDLALIDNVDTPFDESDFHFLKSDHLTEAYPDNLEGFPFDSEPNNSQLDSQLDSQFDSNDSIDDGGSQRDSNDSIDDPESNSDEPIDSDSDSEPHPDSSLDSIDPSEEPPRLDSNEATDALDAILAQAIPIDHEHLPSEDAEDAAPYAFENVIHRHSPAEFHALIHDFRRAVVLLFTEFTDDCYMCYRAERALLAAGASLLEQGDSPGCLPPYFAQVDCFRNPKFCDAMRASVYPALSVFAFGAEHRLRGPLDSPSALLLHIASASHHHVPFLAPAALPAALTRHAVLFLAFFSPDHLSQAAANTSTTQLAHAFLKASAPHTAANHFFAVSPDDLVSALATSSESAHGSESRGSVENTSESSPETSALWKLLLPHAVHGNIVCLRHTTTLLPDVVPFAGRLSPYPFSTWLKLANSSHVTLLRGPASPSSRHSSPALFLWCDSASEGCPARYWAIVDSAAPRFAANTSFHVGTEATISAGFSELLGEGKSLPAMLISHADVNNSYAFRYREGQEITVRSVGHFLRSFYSYTSKVARRKAAPVVYLAAPQSEDSALERTERNLTEVLSALEHKVAVFMRLSACKFSSNASNHYATAIQRSHLDPSLFLELNLLTDHYPPIFSSYHAPALFIVDPTVSPYDVQPYSGSFEVASLITFFHQHLTREQLSDLPPSSILNDIHI